MRSRRPRLEGSKAASAAVASTLILLGILAVTTTGLPAQTPSASSGTAGATIRHVPAELTDTAWLEARRAAQIKAIAGSSVFHDFQFTDRRAESGITFRHRIVSDAGKTYKAVHYDHGNGLAVADVDGDGRLDVYFVNQIGGNELWRNTGGGRFENVTDRAGVAVRGKISVSASFADIDNDGDPDLYVTTVRDGNMLFENDGKGTFRDISFASGLNHVAHSSGAVFFDYDRDGRLDVFLVNVGVYTTNFVGGEGYDYYVGLADAFSGHLIPERAEPSVLFRNEGNNRFRDVSRETGVADLSWSGDASAIDVNEDGWLDLYVLSMQGDDQYYENVGGTRFERRSREVFPRTSWGAMGIKVFDVNNDGRLDIFITDMHSDMSANVGPEHEHMKSTVTWPEDFRGDGSTSIWGNSLFVREATGRFREASEEFNTENYWPWGASVGDLNSDGLDDVFITASMNYPFRYSTNALKLNEAGRRFVDAEFVLGVEPRAEVATPWFDLDASGPDRDHPDAAGATGRVSVWAAKGSRSSAIFDIDGDGDLDIVTSEFNAEPMVLVSNLSEKRPVHFVGVDLTGSASNRDGLGAIVRVTAGGSTYTKVMDGNSGYLSHSVYPLHFGLGNAERVDRIDVEWPSGRRQAVTSGITIDSVVEVREPAQ